jgi:thioredoxin 1
MMGGLTAGGGYLYQRFLLAREHDNFTRTVETEVQSISTLHIPDTKTILTQRIYSLLDEVGANYEPHHVRVDIAREQQRMQVQIWYQRPLFGWLPQSQKMFYASAEKMGFAEIVEPPPPNVVVSAEVAVTPENTEPEPAVTLETVNAEPTAALPRYTAPLVGTDADFQRLVLESPVPVLVYFWAEWCGYCRQATTSVQAAAREFSGRATIVTVDIDRAQRTGRKYGVRGVPLFLMFRDGEIVGRRVGFGGERVLFAFIREYLFE